MHLQCDLPAPLHCSVLVLCDRQEVPHLLWDPFKDRQRTEGHAEVQTHILTMKRGQSPSPGHMPSSPGFWKQPRKKKKKEPRPELPCRFISWVCSVPSLSWLPLIFWEFSQVQGTPQDIMAPAPSLGH